MLLYVLFGYTGPLLHGLSSRQETIQTIFHLVGSVVTRILSFKWNCTGKDDHLITNHFDFDIYFFFVHGHIIVRLD